MKSRYYAWLFAAIFTMTLFASAAAWGADIELTVERNPTGTNHFSTIQLAIDEAARNLNNTQLNSYHILVKADKDHPYLGPIVVKNKSVPIIGERTGETIITGTGTLISVNNLDSVGEIRNFTFRNPSTGISISNSTSPSITNCVFQDGGTAIVVQNSTSVSITNNTFYNNTVAINTDTDIEISNNIFANNKTAISTGITLRQLSYCDFSANASNGVTDLGDHSIPSSVQASANPKFVNEGGRDFHLQSGSPCIGSGNPNSSFRNSFNSSSDMGAFGGSHADIPAPTTISGLAATLDLPNARISYTWNATNDNRVTAYRVYFGPSSGDYRTTIQSAQNPSPLEVAGVATTSAILTGLSVTAPPQPAAPTLNPLTKQDRSLLATWIAVAGATGYRISFGTDAAALTSSFDVDGGATSSTVISGLVNGTTYFVQVSALAQNRVFAAVTAVVDRNVPPNFGSASVNESSFSNENKTVVAEHVSDGSQILSGVPEAPTPFPNLKNEGCFIATAAYGFYSAPQVQALRDFRDRYLLTNAPGRAFVAWYYHYGPLGAHFLNQHPWLKVPVRMALFPLVVGALFLKGATPLALTALLALTAVLCAAILCRKLPGLRRHLPKGIFLTLLICIAPNLALGAEPRPDRPHWSLELKGGTFFPQASDWSKFYGSSYVGEYGGALAYKVLRQVEVGLAASYLRTSGKGQFSDGTLAGDVTYELVPLDAFVLVRGLFSEDQLLVPYLGGGYTRLFYREQVQGQGAIQGSVNGFHARGGLQILLDGLETDASRSLYQDYGIHHSYLFVEGKYLHARADANPGGSVNLGGTSVLGGFLFEF